MSDFRVLVTPALRTSGEANEPGSAKEVIGISEGALGCEEEGWRYISLEPSVPTKDRGSLLRMIVRESTVLVGSDVRRTSRCWTDHQK
jgi:hypothetical protein